MDLKARAAVAKTAARKPIIWKEGSAPAMHRQDTCKQEARTLMSSHSSNIIISKVRSLLADTPYFIYTVL
jgi:hypothetical protein